MKLTRLIHLLLCVLVVFVSISGCGRVVQNAAKLADDYADDALRLAKQAQQHADDASQATSLEEYLARRAQANRIAQEAQEAARNAQSYKNQIDDPAILNKVDDASGEASAAINRLRLYIYQANVDNISTRITDNIPAEYRDAAKKVVTAVFCQTLSQRLAGPLPEREQVVDNVRFRAILLGHDPDKYPEIVAEYIRGEADHLADNLQRQEEVQGYRDACEDLMGYF